MMTKARPLAILGGAWTPAKIGSDILRLQADKITGLNDGENVLTWADGSSQSNDFTAPASKEPTYETGVINSLPVVRFASADRLNCAGFGNWEHSQAYTILAVAKFGNNANGATLLSRCNPTTVGWWAFAYTQSNQRMYFCNRDAAILRKHGISDSHSAFNIHSMTYSGNNDVNSWVWRKNGSVISLATTNGGTPTTIVNAGPANVSDMASSAAYTLKGDVAEIWVWGSVLSGDDIGLVELWLSEKYSIALP
jgi:hypothetical protein